MRLFLFLLLLVGTLSAHAASLPGFRAERLGRTDGLPTSVVVDSRGQIYYTTREGGLYRWDVDRSHLIATVTTTGSGHSGLLGMALLDDDEAVVHYTTPQQTHDIISLIGLRTGAESILHSFVADIEVPGRGTPDEHHGGNPSIGPDGTIFVGIGDYSYGYIARDTRWNGGKIFRIDRHGTAIQFAHGLRNPFDMAWDAENGRLIVADNGPIGGDEIHVVPTEGANLGWPDTWGDRPPAAGGLVPEYVFPNTVAPTGMVLLSGAGPYALRGFLLGGFVSRAIYYFPRVDQPLTLIERETPPVIDVTQGLDGTIYFVTGEFEPGAGVLYRLTLPRPGDCNGDGNLDWRDRDALDVELAEAAGQRTIDVHQGLHQGSWGCDADQDGRVTAADAVVLNRLLATRRRSVVR